VLPRSHTGHPHEAGIFTTLSPGAFAAILAGQDPSTGTGLIEI
jgi:hypothetical protein